jgi:hypothetical protein
MPSKTIKQSSTQARRTDARRAFLSYRPLNTPPLAAGMKAGLFPLPGEGKLKKGWASCMLVRSEHEPTRPQRA